MRQLVIFVSGPYSASDEATKVGNVDSAAKVGRDLLAKGHIPFVPHSMTFNWECDERLSYDAFLSMCLQYIERCCDALLYLGPSPGADRELAWATECGLTIYRSVDEVPEVSVEEASVPDEDSLKGQLAEFEAAQQWANEQFTPPKGETITQRFLSGCRRWLRKSGSLFTQRWSEPQLYREVEEEIQDAYSMLTAMAKVIGVWVDHDLVCLVVGVLRRLQSERMRVDGPQEGPS